MTASKLIPPSNYSQIPNVIFDYWYQKLDHCTSLVLSYLCRKTFGWHKNKDCISIKKIEDALNMSRPRVIKSLCLLEENGLIKKSMHVNECGDNDPNTYEIIVSDGVVNDINHPSNDIAPPGSKQNLPGGSKQNLPGGSKQNLPGVVNGVYPQKKEIQKKEIQKKDNTSEDAKAPPVASAEAERLNKLLIQKIKEINPKILTGKEDSNKKWIKEFELMISRDGRSPEDIEAIINWFPTHSFWSGPIQSPFSLRKSFGLMINQMNPKTSLEDTNRHFVQHIMSEYPQDLKHLKINSKYVLDPTRHKELYFANHPEEQFKNLFFDMVGAKEV